MIGKDSIKLKEFQKVRIEIGAQLMWDMF